MPEAATAVRELADEYVGVLFVRDPLAPTLLGVEGPHDALPDLSVEAEQDFRDRFIGIVERAEAIEPTWLTAADRVTRATIVQQARAQIAVIDSAIAEFTVTDFFVGATGVLLSLLPVISLTDADRAEAYLRRLSAVPGYLDGALTRHRAGIAAGRTPVASRVAAAIKYLDRYLADPDADPLRKPAPPQEIAANFNHRRDAVLAEVVRPAIARYRDALTEHVLPHGRPDEEPGLCWLPAGEARYAALAGVYTTTDRSPLELHETGMALIDALGREYAEIGSRVFGTADCSEIFARLRNDTALRWSSGEELLTTARETVARAEQATPRWFGLAPEQPCEVRPVPPADAPTSIAAYYMPPSLDGSRPGVYYANNYRPEKRSRHVAEALAFHEAVPGHHFQISIAQQLTDLPMLRRIAEVTAYAEGWGLYCERLADEMGLYTDDVARLGMLTFDSMRAGRLVVDTGLHAKGWSRQQAVDYLIANTPMPEVEIQAEIDRYISFPGQALAYMVGRLELQRLRSQAQRELGERFDIRAFHDLVLGGGALPLSVLAEVVSDWVNSLA